jgi:hypothetical protein
VRRAALCLLVAALAAGGCGGGQAHEVLSKTAANLGKIHSGDLTLRLVVSPRAGTKGRIGFILRGPFALRPGKLPVAKVAYTQIAGAHEATATFISTGSQAWAEVNGRLRALSPAATETIRQASAGGPGGLGLDIASWVKDPTVSSEGDLDHVSAKLDVVNAANGLLGLLRNLGRAAPTIEGAEAERLRDAVTSSDFDVWTSKHGRLLRRLLLKAELGLTVPSELRRVLGDVVGAKVEFELSIARPNQPVTVNPPS